MNRTTAILLVCLRLAIGWHFLVEGWHKVHSHLVGPAETSRVFSAEGYFREAPGPLARILRAQLGDPDDELLARLTVQPLPADVEPAKYPAHNRVPPALAKDWDEYLARFSQHYALQDWQKKLADTKLQQMKHNFVVWLTRGQKQVKKPFPTGDVERVESNPERIREYQALWQKVRDTYDKELPRFGRDVEKGRLLKTKAELVQERKELASDLDEQTVEMKKVLADVLTLEQRQEVPIIVGGTVGNLGSAFGQGPILASALLLAGRGEAFLPVSPPPSSMLQTFDLVTAWGLFAIGAGLLLGLFSRFWCILGAAFLCLTYLVAPPMPWWPVPPQQEGTYLFVNKNVIEMLALLTLATTRSGRWFGLDALLHGVWTGFRREDDKHAY